MNDKTIGQYRLISKIGEGGMGTVFEAEQQHPKRRVALKVIRGGQYVDETAIKMFQREAQSLALLKHSSIAAIYESGRTEEGQHFFAMELVKGISLTEWLEERTGDGISPAEVRLRLGLFKRICEGVSYAHQRGVIHRDLKPGNILVMDEPGEVSDTSSYFGPAIKILDFGLARITESDVAMATMATEVGTIMGTLPYMSPEQVHGIPEAIDVRSDVYALGVLLYEILTGQLPLPVSEAAFHDALRTILEVSPTPISKIWSGERKVDRDLEVIALKALEKEPERRYQSALALAEDVDRYMGDQPVLARPPSTIYQLRKMVKRHTLASALTTSLVALVIAFSFISVAQARRAERARDESEAVTGFLSDMLASVDPTEIGRDVQVQDVLEVAADDLNAEFDNQPLIRARLHHTIGIVYNSLGEYPKAGEHLLDAIGLRRAELGERNPLTYDSMYHLAVAYYWEWRLEEGMPLILSALEGHRSTLGESAFQTLLSMNLLALYYLDQGETDKAETIAEEALEKWRLRKAAGDIEDEKKEAEEKQTALNTIFAVKMTLGHFDEAEPIILETVANDRRISGPEHPYTLASMHNVASCYQAQGRLAEAESLYVETLELRKVKEGEHHSNTLGTMGNLAEIYSAQGRYIEAESLFNETLGIYAATPGLGENHPRYLRYIQSLIQLYESWGKPDKAAEWRAKLPPDMN